MPRPCVRGIGLLKLLTKYQPQGRISLLRCCRGLILIGQPDTLRRLAQLGCFLAQLEDKRTAIMQFLAALDLQLAKGLQVHLALLCKSIAQRGQHGLDNRFNIFFLLARARNDKIEQFFLLKLVAQNNGANVSTTEGAAIEASGAAEVSTSVTASTTGAATFVLAAFLDADVFGTLLDDVGMLYPALLRFGCYF